MEYLPISQDGSNRCWPLPRYLLYFLFLLFFCQEAETICLNWLRHLFRIWTSLVIQLLVLIKYVLLFFFIYFLVLSTTIRTLKDVIIFDNPTLMCLHLWYKLWDAMKEQSKLLLVLFLFWSETNYLFIEVHKHMQQEDELSFSGKRKHLTKKKSEP